MHAGSKGGHGVIADIAKLKHQRVAAQHHIIADVDMAGQGSVVGKNSVAAHHAVVRQMHISHNPVVIADAGFAQAGNGAGVEGGEFADGVAVADNQAGGLVAVFFVLRLRAE